MKRKKGFTLIELLVVIVIVLLLAALLLPAILKALCTARAGTAKHLIDQVGQASKAYELDWAVYPPGDGTGSKEVAFYLQQNGPKKTAYFAFQPDMLDVGGNILNPVYSDDEPPKNLIYYRNNYKPGSGPGGAGGKGGGGAGGGGAGGPPVMFKNGIDIWCAGCDYTPTVDATKWSVNNWN
jgi:prepilin-type N-terminal cleavage/methylation domain-containing protein